MLAIGVATSVHNQTHFRADGVVPRAVAINHPYSSIQALDEFGAMPLGGIDPGYVAVGAIKAPSDFILHPSLLLPVFYHLLFPPTATGNAGYQAVALCLIHTFIPLNQEERFTTSRTVHDLLLYHLIYTADLRHACVLSPIIPTVVSHLFSPTSIP
jgi:hypothetical protein